jgi:hypothetical protein
LNEVILVVADGARRGVAHVCGIIGYVGPRECKVLLLNGLERLEYRGYDSAGIALLEESGLAYTRATAARRRPPDSGTPAGRRTAA